MGEYEDRLIKERYCANGENNWKDITERIVGAVCKTAEDISDMRDLIGNKDFIPNSPTVMNAGTASGQLSACFVLPVEDSIPSIFDAVKNAAIIHKTGGGTGFSFTSLRAEGSTVKSTNGVASGVVSFMEVFDAATNAIKQGGKRRGANMGVLEYTHPEILKFIKCKRTEGKIKNFNLSVMLDDKFMKMISTTYPRGNSDYDDVFKEIVEGIYQNGEPGVLFKDTINRDNPNPELGDMVATNPCGEQPLLPNESCNLGSINLANFVLPDGEIDFNRLYLTTYAAVRFLDAVIDANKYPLEEIETATKRTRKIGLGVMGFHDMLLKMRIPYDDERAFSLGEKLMSYIDGDAYVASCHLSGDMRNPKNSTRTTIAPTGTISILAGVSSGIEPVFAWAYTRKDTTGERVVVHPQFDAELKIICEREGDMNLYHDVVKHVMEKGTIQDIDWLPEDFKKLFRGAMDISYQDHIKMQASFQKHVNNAVSKTINMPKEATREDIAKAIILAWKSNCKGLTIYRSGSRDEEVLCLTKASVTETSSQKKMETDHITVTDNIIDWVEDEFYESITPAYIYKVRSGCGKFYVIVGHDGESPTKVFVEGDGTGGCTGNMAAIGRSISVGLDCGTPAESYVKQFGRVKCNTAMNNKQSGGKSCADITGKCINNTVNRLACIIEQNNSVPVLAASNKIPVAPQNQQEQCCDNPKFVMQEGCQVCLNCGKSKCS
jgi:ribonucleoside-diphosphate reductase alpha chain